MNRTQKFKKNTITSLLNRVIILLSGLILPRLILTYYGSEINGLVASITQFLSIITFLDLGVGSVVQSALYRPLAKKDLVSISEILNAAQKYFRRISYVLIVYVVILVFFYPAITNSQNLDFLSTALLIIAISISSFAQYYYGIVNELLLNADQRSYIQLSTEIVVVVLNLLASIFLITQGMSIQVVKLSTSLIYLVRPIYLSYYIKKNYDLVDEVEAVEDPIPDKWSGMGQHVAYSIQSSTDIVVLTLFSTLENVSIYSVYNMVMNAISMVISSFTTGFTSFFGNLLANEEIALLNRYFSKIEWGIHTGVTFLYGMTAVLINSFVMMYTSGITDVNYYAPMFSLILVLAKAAYSLRTPYQALVFSAGDFKQTQLSSIIEASLNIVLSLLLIDSFGLVGLALGTLISMVYRTLYLAWYLSKNIVNRSIRYFAKHILVDLLTLGTMLINAQYIMNQIIIVSSIVEWIIAAVLIAIIFIIIVLVINLIFYRDMVIYAYKKIFKKKV